MSSSVRATRIVTKNYQLGISGGFGFLLAHRASMRQLVKGHAQEIEFNYTRKPNNKQYAYTFKNPDVGFTAVLHFVGNAESIGIATGGYPFIRFPFNGNKNSAGFKVGGGLGFVQKPFNQQDNIRNITIGSYINSIIHFSLDGKADTENIIFNYGIGITHYSNGGYSAPNLGLNIPTLRFGMQYKVKREVQEEELIQIALFRTHGGHEIYVMGGLRESNLHNPNKYFTGSLTYQYLRQFRDKFAWSAGADAFYNRSLPAMVDSDDQLGSSPFRAGGFIGIETMLDDISLFVNQGVYAYNDYKLSGIFYHRIGIRKRFKWNKGIVLNVALRSHWAVAEYFEFGIGYNFR